MEREPRYCKNYLQPAADIAAAAVGGVSVHLEELQGQFPHSQLPMGRFVVEVQTWNQVVVAAVHYPFDLLCLPEQAWQLGVALELEAADMIGPRIVGERAHRLVLLDSLLGPQARPRYRGPGLGTHQIERC